MRGLGRIFKRGPIWWIAYYYRGTEKRESSESSRESDAKKLLKKRQGEIGCGKFIGAIEEKLMFEQLSEILLEDYKANERKALKAVSYPIKHLQDSFGFDRALDITTDRIKKHITRRQDSGARNATINRELAALKRMFSLAIQAGKLSFRPYIPTLEENNARQGFLNYGSFLLLREALPEYLKDPIGFLYYSGWRVSEMRALEWRDVDLPGKVIRLRPEISKNKEGRLLPLNGDILALIRRANSQRRLDCAHVFHSDGQKIGTFRKAWKSACKIAGLNGTIPHDLRRTAVRNLIRAGVPERVAMTLSGHKTRNIFDRYNIVSEADLMQAAERVQAYLAAQPTESTVVPVKAAG